jgi:hypothetical protein
MKHTFEVELFDGGGGSNVIERLKTSAKSTKDAIKEVGHKIDTNQRFRVVQVRTELMSYEPAAGRVLGNVDQTEMNLD